MSTFDQIRSDLILSTYNGKEFYNNHRKTKQDGGEENEELWSSVDKENLIQNVWTRVSLPISGK